MSNETHSATLKQADEAQRRGDFVAAKELLTRLRAETKDEDPHLVQRLALVTYKSEQPTRRAALEEARELLLALGPATSDDAETLGLWGAVHKRLWGETGDRSYLDEAVRSYERGFRQRQDYYNGINLAFLLNDRAAALSHEADSASAEEAARLRAEAVACAADAVEVRREVLSICQSLLDKGGLADEQKYWVLATMAEAHLGVGDEEGASRKLGEAHAVPSAGWMWDSTEEQMSKLRVLLANSPLRHADGGAV